MLCRPDDACLDRPAVDQLQLVERLVDRERGCPGVLAHLQHAVDHVRGGARAAARRVGEERPQRGDPSGQWLGQAGRDLGRQALHNWFEFAAEKLLAGEAYVGQDGVVEVVRHAELEPVLGRRAVKGREQHGVDGHRAAMLGVARRLEHDPRLPGQVGSARAWSARAATNGRRPRDAHEWPSWARSSVRAGAPNGSATAS